MRIWANEWVRFGSYLLVVPFTRRLVEHLDGDWVSENLGVEHSRGRTLAHQPRRLEMVRGFVEHLEVDPRGGNIGSGLRAAIVLVGRK